MSIEITILVSVISVSFAVFFGIKSAKRADIEDVEERAKKNAEIRQRKTEAGNRFGFLSAGLIPLRNFPRFPLPRGRKVP